jgi:SNF2 family DNA or RNA helicase
MEDWFGITGGIETDGEEIPLAVLLEAVRQGRRYVRLTDNRFAQITSELQQRLKAADRLLSPGRKGLLVGRAAALQLPELLPEALGSESDASWLALCARIRQAQQLTPKLPSGLRATLRDYQLEGYAWLCRLAAWDAGACLADDMGLGKTVQTLALLLQRASLGPALIVAPTSVGLNWVAEGKRFTPELRVVEYRGANRKEILTQLGPGVALVTSYDILAMDIKALASEEFSTFVIDEAQAIKNATTQRARAARQIRASFRLALTGTPIENHLGELWSLFQLIVPGLLGSWEHFRRSFALPIERDHDEASREALVQLLRPFLLRRTKEEVARELPPRTEVIRPVELSQEERCLYDGARRQALETFIASQASAGQDQIHLFAVLTRLRRLACHPRLFDQCSNIPSSKLAAALEMLEELVQRGGRALVFSQFTGHLQLLGEALSQRGQPYLYLDGATAAAARGELVRRWAEGNEALFLISLKAGGTGMNLTGADMVLHLDPWWNPAVEDQATDRTHRIGQLRPVTVVRLIAQGTIEEAVLSLHDEKRNLARSILAGADQAARLSTQQLLDLIRWGSEGEAGESPSKRAKKR